MEEQSALASTSQAMHSTMSGAPDLRCAKETERGTKCIRKGARRVIGPACESFCRDHFMQGISQLMELVSEGVTVSFMDTSFKLGFGYMVVDSVFNDNSHMVGHGFPGVLQEFISEDKIIQSGNFDLKVMYELMHGEPSEEFQTNARFSNVTPDGKTIALEPDKWKFKRRTYGWWITLVFMIRDDIMVEDDELLAV
jgi:hypothetical protein